MANYACKNPPFTNIIEMRRFLCAILFTIIAFSACQKPNPMGVNKFTDAVLLKIKDYQDRRLSDSLVQYFSSKNPFYREDAALAFASIQDSAIVGRLGKLLSGDSIAAVRKAAAYALGQTPSSKSESILVNAMADEKDRRVYAEILESYGKVTRNWRLEVHDDDSIVLHGIAWSFYRSGIKGTSDDSIFNADASFLLNPAVMQSTRLGSAHYFARSARDFERFQKTIIASARWDRSIDVRIASTLALGKIMTDSSRIAAQIILQEDSDYRVRISAIRALQSFPFDQIWSFVLKSLHDENINVGIASSEVIKTTATKAYWKDILLSAREAKNWRIQANLYEAALGATGDNGLAEEIRALYSKTSNPYHKATLLVALQHTISSCEFIQEQLLNATVPVVRSASATSLVAMNYGKSFEPALRKRFATFYINAIKTGDPAVIGTIAGALADPELGYKNVVDDYTFLYAAKQRLSLPKDNEAMQPLEAAIALFEERKLPTVVNNAFNHPIDWSLVTRIPRDQKAVIATTKGKITVRLFVEEAPGSVANFVQLVEARYFDDKYFHRVVPNFVIQTGCNRGDGWGSEDYSIRSEFSGRRYKTGSVGMASAGKDTEGTQWFITHSPTPHLDGRYTIFAEVESGMDVVHQIEVGDKILNIELK